MTTSHQTADPANKPYQRAVLFSGGGSRFGYYVGMYQALDDAGKAPDLIIASCGGSLALGILNIAPTPDAARQLLSSRSCHELIKRIVAKPPNHRSQYLSAAWWRWLRTQQAKQPLLSSLAKLPQKLVSGALSEVKLSGANQASIRQDFYRHMPQSLTDLALFAVCDEHHQPLWQEHKFMQQLSELGWGQSDPEPLTTDLPTTQAAAFAGIIITSEYLGKAAATPWRQVLSCDHQHTVTYLDRHPMECAIHRLAPQWIAADIYATTEIPMATAVRASIADMYYLPPIIWQSRTLTGGVLDLTPIELACHLANTIFAERKSGYDKLLAEPAIYHTYGFLPNQRLQQVMGRQSKFKPKSKFKHSHIHWLDCADNRQHIPAVANKRYRFSQGYVDLSHVTFTKFQTIMQQQWQYGYERTRHALQTQE